MIRQICLNTNPLGAESRILAPSADPERRILHLEEGSVYRPKLNLEVASCCVSFSAFKCFKHLVQWADVVHYHYPWPFADLLHFSTSVRKPTVLTYHSDIVRQKLLGRLYAPLMRRFLGSVDQIICTSPNYAASSDVLSRYQEKVSVIPIGLNEHSYPRADDTLIQSMRSKYGGDFLLFVGVLRYYKGLDILLDAVKDAPFKVLIVGSGPIEAKLKQRARDLQLDNVGFCGSLSDEEKVALLKLCRGVVLPSSKRSEAFGVTLIEGAMQGKPLISTELGSGTSYVNIDGETGFVVPPGSATALRQAMDRLYQHPEQAKLLGKRARKRYEQMFTGQVMGARYYDVYQALTADATDVLSVRDASNE